MNRNMRSLLLVFALALPACVGSAPGPGEGGGADAGATTGDADPDARPGEAHACVPVELPLDAARPAALMPAARLQALAARLPCVGDPWLRGLLSSPDTMFYDHQDMVPGYQDSFGDNVIAPIGMRPNTIASQLIDLAVPGGHAQIFVERGVFHFPFGRPTGAHEHDQAVVDFWKPPRSGASLLPVVWWMRQPNQYTHRLEWLFPVGTVFGELLFVIDEAGERYPFEIRTRVRATDGWNVDVFRPFPTAAAMADALERRRADEPAWAGDPELDTLIAHLRDPGTLEPARLAGTNFPGAFPAIDGAADVLPALADDSILRAALLDENFVSARGAVWKQEGPLVAYAPTTEAELHVVPRGYNGGFLPVDEETCDRCHRDAGRPFRDWYDNILAYGELWGQDETFTWHPFTNDSFVDANGNVVDFNYDNRTLRPDFVDAGLLAPYQPSVHDDDSYRQILREWTNYSY
jgi:hypothetical protein